jgi:hypothetical protein
MSLADLVKSAVSSVKNATAGLLVDVTREPFIGDDVNGNRIYGAETTYSVVLEHKTRFVTAKDQSQQLSKSNIQFLDPMMISELDRITLPDGSQPQILAVMGVMNPDRLIYAPQVFF